jgi:hypothetical protein
MAFIGAHELGDPAAIELTLAIASVNGWDPTCIAYAVLAFNMSTPPPWNVRLQTNTGSVGEVRGVLKAVLKNLDGVPDNPLG